MVVELYIYDISMIMYVFIILYHLQLELHPQVVHDVECRDDSEHHNYIVTTRHFTMTLILQATMQTSAASEKVNFDETDRHAADCLEHHSVKSNTRIPWVST